MKNVSILKELIKEKKARQLRVAHPDASDLILWKAPLPADDSKDANTNAMEEPAATPIPLSPLKKLKEVFPGPLQEDLVHIVFEHRPYL